MARSLIFILLLIFGFPANAKLCPPETPKGEKCRIKIADLHPTQFSYGNVDAKEKLARLQNNNSSKKFLKNNRVEIVIGPEGKFYLVDGHHHTLAAYRESLDEIYVEVIGNYKDYSPAKFKALLQQKEWVRLVDEKGLKRSFEDLPKHVKDMKNDPYRSLAWIVKESKGFDKTQIPYAEFEWADFFRNKIIIGPGKAGWEKAIKEAFHLAAVEKTKFLPGQQKIEASRAADWKNDCWKNFESLKLKF